MKKIRILQVGYQHAHGPFTLDSLLRLPDYFDVVGLADEDPETAKTKVKNAPAFYSIEEALKLDIDAVTIECEEDQATKYAQMFADKGVHVHLDKPGSQDIKAFHRLADTLKEKNLVFHLGYMYRYNPAIIDAVNMAKNGELGDIFAVEAQMSVKHARERRQWLSDYKGGMMYYLGCHLIDIVYRICGEPKEIIPLNCSTGVDGIVSEDYGFVVFKYDNGVSFVKTNASEYNGFDRRQLVITGSLGSVELKPLEILTSGTELHTLTALTLEKDNPRIWGDGAKRLRSDSVDRYDGMMSNFARCILGEKENEYTHDYEKRLFDLVMKCCGVTE